MKTYTRIFLFLVAVFFMSCEKLVMHPEPGTDNISIFDEYSKICIEKYGLAEVKGVDMRFLADSLRPYVTPDLTEDELFNLMGIFVDRMQEGHTLLQSIDFKYNKAYWGWIAGYPLGFNPVIIDQNYYGIIANPEVQIIETEGSPFNIQYGFLPQDEQIGYIRITSFDLENVSTNDIITMMEYLKDAKGMIIDVRGNLGGYIDFATNIASFFTSSEVEAGTNYIKNGPDENDFAASKMKVEPSGSPFTFTKPVIIIQDRSTFSSGSLFCIMMGSMDHVTTLGISFGGGTGDIMDGFLANGWKWKISTSNFENKEGIPTDPGLEVDIPMLINPEDTITDAMIERAILELQD